jgi:hypothetical protein
MELTFSETSTQLTISSEKKTPCILVYKCRRFEEIAASIFKEDFILNWMQYVCPDRIYLSA